MTHITSAGDPLEATGSAHRGPPPGAPGDADPTATRTGTPSEVRLQWIAVSAIRENPRQPRHVFDDDALDELTASIAEVGLLQPLVVRPHTPQPVDEEVPPPAWDLVAGERRLRSIRRLGWVTVPALVRETADADLLRDALVENIQRAQLNPLEEAAAYEQLLADFGCTHDEIASRVGRSRPHISNTLRLLRLPPAVQRRVAAGVLSQGHARALLALPDAEAMERLAARIVAEGLSVRSVEEIVAVGGQVDEDGSRVRPRSRPVRRAELTEAADELADILDTRVSVSMGRVKGKVTIEFAGHEDLDRILGILAGRTPT